MRKVTLTFDNGPDPEVTPVVLDCLKRHEVRATFFVVGRRAGSDWGTSMVRRASEEGHLIGNHTFSHAKPLGELDRATALQEFERTEEALAWLAQPQRLFRPYGRAGKLGRHLLHPVIVEKLQSGGYTCVLWNCVPGDWKDADGWVERALADCASRDWSLVVLHDTAGRAMSHLDHFIQRLRESGVEIGLDYPPDCVPIVDGKIVGELEPYVTPVEGR